MKADFPVPIGVGHALRVRRRLPGNLILLCVTSVTSFRWRCGLLLFRADWGRFLCSVEFRKGLCYTCRWIGAIRIEEPSCPQGAHEIVGSSKFLECVISRLADRGLARVPKWRKQNNRVLRAAAQTLLYVFLHYGASLRYLPDMQQA